MYLARPLRPRHQRQDGNTQVLSQCSGTEGEGGTRDNGDAPGLTPFKRLYQVGVTGIK